MTDGGFARTYGVELLFSTPPRLGKRAVLDALAARCPGVAPLDSDRDAGLLAFVHPGHRIELADGWMYAQTLVAEASGPPEVAKLDRSLEQSWDFPEARARAAAATSAVLVTDILSSWLDYRVRLDLVQRAVLALVELARPDAIHWHPSLHIVDPDVFVRASGESPAALFLTGALNVRLFNIEGSDGELVMDTLGLAALGLPDVQCHFRELEPNAVASFLYNTGLYLFDNGDVIEDGHTIEGLEPESRWRCQHETALVEPEREVLDVNPGAPFAAGRRR